MKKTTGFFLAVAVIFLTSCNQFEETGITDNGNKGPVVLSVIIDSENSAKATLAEEDGTFRFTPDDAIRVHNGAGAYTGTTASNSNSGSFSMPEGFEINRGGIAGFPAELVIGITSSSVTFTLPTTYTYSQVGSDNPNTCRAMAPMVGVYSAPSSGYPQVTLKQAGSVVRFKLTNIAAGSVSFTFPATVTGHVTISSSPAPSSWGDEDGIRPASLSPAGSTITVTGFPNVTDGTYVYVTLPVPTGITPDEILVINTPDDGSTYRQIAVTTGAGTMNRACGYKIGARPFYMREPRFQVAADREVVLSPGNLAAKIGTYEYATLSATASEWKFQGPFEFVGKGSETGNYLFYQANSSSCEGKWVDMFAWQGTGTDLMRHGIIKSSHYGDNDPGDDITHITTYAGCWETKSGNPSSDLGDYIHITNGGEYTWRPMSSEEWYYLLLTRETSTLNGTANARFARARIGSSDGLLLFPEDIGENWNTLSMGALPTQINSTDAIDWSDSFNHYTATQYNRMQEVGVMFIPKSGIYNGSFSMDRGFYWTNTSSPKGHNNATGGKYAYRISIIDGEQFYTSDLAHTRSIAAAVRLVRDVPTTP